MYEQNPNAPTTFTLVQTVTSDDITGGNDFFGFAVGVSGTMLLAGAPHYTNSNWVQTGAVWQFKYDGSSWLQLGKLFPLGVKGRLLKAATLHALCICVGGTKQSPAYSSSILSRNLYT